MRMFRSHTVRRIASFQAVRRFVMGSPGDEGAVAERWVA